MASRSRPAAVAATSSARRPASAAWSIALAAVIVRKCWLISPAIWLNDVARSPNSSPLDTDTGLVKPRRAARGVPPPSAPPGVTAPAHLVNRRRQAPNRAPARPGRGGGGAAPGEAPGALPKRRERVQAPPHLK